MNIIDIAYASSEAVTEATSAGDGGILGSLGINLPLFLFQLINFAVVILVLWFLILKPLSKKLTERQNLIADSLENAKKVQAKLEQSEKDYQAELRRAKAEAAKILEQATQDSEKFSVEMKVKVKKEIEVLITQAKKNIQSEKEEMLASLRAETADLVVLALEKILSEKMNDEKDKKLINKVLQDLK